MSTEVYTISTSLTSGFEGQQLTDEINLDGGIAPSCLGIMGDSDGDTITIHFDGVLSAGEQTTLDGILSTHTPLVQGDKIMNITVNYPDITDTIYETVLTFLFQGTDILVQTTNIGIISYMDDGGTSYTTRLVDTTNNNVIASSIHTNTDEDLCDLGTLSNLPNKSSIFELQAKVTGSTTAVIKNLHMCYN